MYVCIREREIIQAKGTASIEMFWQKHAWLNERLSEIDRVKL